MVDLRIRKFRRLISTFAIILLFIIILNFELLNATEATSSGDKSGDLKAGDQQDSSERKEVEEADSGGMSENVSSEAMGLFQSSDFESELQRDSGYTEDGKNLVSEAEAEIEAETEAETEARVKTETKTETKAEAEAEELAIDIMNGVPPTIDQYPPQLQKDIISDKETEVSDPVSSYSATEQRHSSPASSPSSPSSSSSSSSSSPSSSSSSPSSLQTSSLYSSSKFQNMETPQKSSTPVRSSEDSEIPDMGSGPDSASSRDPVSVEGTGSIQGPVSSSWAKDVNTGTEEKPDSDSFSDESSNEAQESSSSLSFSRGNLRLSLGNKARSPRSNTGLELIDRSMETVSEGSKGESDLREDSEFSSDLDNQIEFPENSSSIEIRTEADINEKDSQGSTMERSDTKVYTSTRAAPVNKSVSSVLRRRRYRRMMSSRGAGQLSKEFSKAKPKRKADFIRKFVQGLSDEDLSVIYSAVNQERMIRERKRLESSLVSTIPDSPLIGKPWIQREKQKNKQ
ncbi:dentin sialophosphoprotein [Cryptosporidium felis]|nr:dentin sialophosphoprotein [Cryptosporidium felis]